MKPYTFSNGVTVPAGVTLASCSGGVHLDDTVYPNAADFDGFRFSKRRELDGESSKYHSVNTGPEFLVFGHGEHAWSIRSDGEANVSPGRFFAVNELKLLLSFVLTRYDIKTENAMRPQNWEFGIRTLPDMSAKILFRRRHGQKATF